MTAAALTPARAARTRRHSSPDIDHARRVAAACAQIEECVRAGVPAPTLEELAQPSGLSPFHFHRVFKAATGQTPAAWARARRAAALRATLPTSRRVTDAVYDAGYGAASRFYAQADAALGMAPADYRAGGRGQTIRFAVGQCALGAILVAESERGLCAIALGDEPEVLVRQLQDQFPQAELVGGDAAFEQHVARVIGFVEQPRIGLELPLDVRGSAFQQRVWQALRQVPAGSTVSYAEIARRIGQPSASRAVAQACAANPLAVAIPCHRVVRSDGALSGYRWGVERKATLLGRERS
ncbi:MAG: bifunctional DNA-binding transcriptional regulator/O6-methylguanine-DNA methyltransferase Ada [Burkholderiaceae bacterium]